MDWRDIQKLYDNATDGDTILLPPGEWNVYSTLNFTGKQVTIRGQGCVLIGDPQISPTVRFGDTYSALLEGVEIAGPENGDGLVIEGVSYSEIRRVWVRNCKRGVVVRSSMYLGWDSLVSAECDEALVAESGCMSVQAFTNCTLVPNPSGVGIHISGVRGWNFYGGVIESKDIATAVQIDSMAEMGFYGTHWEVGRGDPFVVSEEAAKVSKVLVAGPSGNKIAWPVNEPWMRLVI